MFVSNVVNGLLIGFPLMLAVGPIAILLLDQGLSRGARASVPAAFGVASADLTFSVLAAVAGTSIAVFLAPITSWLSLAAVALLLVLAVRLFRGAVSELRSLGADAVPSPPLAMTDIDGFVLDAGVAGIGEPATGSVNVVGGNVVGGNVDGDWYSTTIVAEPGRDTDRGLASSRAVIDSGGTSVADVADVSSAEPATVPASDVTFGHLTGLRLGAAFYGLTVVNPLTIVLFAAVVVAGGAGAGTPGWAVGVALSSLIVHSGWVLLGAALGTTLGPVAVARMRLGASVLMAGLALHFLLG